MVLAAGDLDDRVTVEILLAQTDHFLGELDLGIGGSVCEPGTRLTHVVETPRPDIARLIDSEGCIVASTDHDCLACAGAEDDLLWSGAVDLTALQDFAIVS